MTIFIFMLGILLPVGLGAIVWKKFDHYFPRSNTATELTHYLKKLMCVFVITLISMYVIFLFI